MIELNQNNAQATRQLPHHLRATRRSAREKSVEKLAAWVTGNGSLEVLSWVGSFLLWAKDTHVAGTCLRHRKHKSWAVGHSGGSQWGHLLGWGLISTVSTSKHRSIDTTAWMFQSHYTYSTEINLCKYTHREVQITFLLRTIKSNLKDIQPSLEDKRLTGEDITSTCLHIMPANNNAFQVSSTSSILGRHYTSYALNSIVGQPKLYICFRESFDYYWISRFSQRYLPKMGNST